MQSSLEATFSVVKDVTINKTETCLVGNTFCFSLEIFDIILYVLSPKEDDKMVCFLDTEKKLDPHNNLFFCSCFLMVEVAEKSFVFHCIYVCPEITFEHSV